jgi:hypothetical protein
MLNLTYSCIWSDIFQFGLPPLSDLFDRVTHRWTAEEQARIFHDYAEWIAGLPTEQHGSAQNEGYLPRRLNRWNEQDFHCAS